MMKETAKNGKNKGVQIEQEATDANGLWRRRDTSAEGNYYSDLIQDVWPIKIHLTKHSLSLLMGTSVFLTPSPARQRAHGS
jgi:hypothetical protein